MCIFHSENIKIELIFNPVKLDVQYNTSVSFFLMEQCIEPSKNKQKKSIIFDTSGF